MRPDVPLSAYKTYRIASPHATHSRPATCAEVNCEQYSNGWMIPKSVVTEQVMHDLKVGRWRFREIDLTGLDQSPQQGVFLMFEAGQPCLAASTHRVSLERPEIYRVGRGRGVAFSARNSTVLTPENWLDDFWHNQDRLQTLANRG